MSYMANHNAPTLAAMSQTKRASKTGKLGQGMVDKHAGTPSPQCKAGMHHECIKKKCGCTKCTHRGIR